VSKILSNVNILHAWSPLQTVRSHLSDTVFKYDWNCTLPHKRSNNERSKQRFLQRPTATVLRRTIYSRSAKWYLSNISVDALIYKSLRKKSLYKRKLYALSLSFYNIPRCILNMRWHGRRCTFGDDNIKQQRGIFRHTVQSSQRIGGYKLGKHSVLDVSILRRPEESNECSTNQVRKK